MTNPPTLRRTLLLTLLLLAATAALRADHLVGGDFSYRFLGYIDNDTLSGDLRYEITLKMYRDCVESDESAWFDGASAALTPPSHTGRPVTPMHFTVFRNRQVFMATVTEMLDSFRPLDEAIGNPCLETNADICQQVGFYVFELRLPQGDDDYTISYARCCRNPLTNINNATNEGSTYSMTITAEAQRRRSSSPVFNLDPPITICLQELQQFDQGATDIDGDSLSYEICTPVLGGGRDNPNDPMTPTFSDDLWPLIEDAPPYTSVDWRTPIYGPNQPLGAGSIFEYVDTSGLLIYQPAFQGTHVLAICVQEWTRGPNPVLLSETRRELQFNVVACSNIVNADLLETEIDEDGNFFIRACGLGPQTIINESTEPKAIRSYDWEVELPGGLFTGTTRDLSIPSVTEEGVYDGRMILNRFLFADNCKDTAFFKLGVFPDSYPDFEFAETGCDDEPISFTNLSTTDADFIDSYAWDFDDGSPTARSTNKDEFHRYQIPGVFNVNMTIVDNNQCEWETTKRLDHFPNPRTIILEPGPGFGCQPYAKNFVNRSVPIDSTYIFRWEFGDGGTSDAMNPSHLYEEQGVFDVYLSIESPEGCFVDTTFRRLIDVRQAPEADFIFEPEQPTSLRPEFIVRDRSAGSLFQRYAIEDQAGNELMASPTDGFEWLLRDTSRIYVTQVVTHPSGCIDSLTKALAMELDNTYYLPNAFSPNGDGLNDLFFPVGIFDGISDYQLRIWNRWGELIFTTDDVNGFWDGQYKGKEAPGGGYLWDAQYLNDSGERRRFKGGVTLIR